MKCFLVYVKEWDYDTYDGVVVMADSEEEVRGMMHRKEGSFNKDITYIEGEGVVYPPYFYDWQGEIKIEEITTKGIVLASFNAG